MSKQIPFLLISLIFIYLPSIARAQFINLQITIEPELSAKVEQELSFGTLITNSGVKALNLGDGNNGIFSIRAYHTQNLFLEFSYPDALVNTSLTNNDEIPIELSAAYNNSGENKPNNAIPLSGDKGYISFQDNQNSLNETQIWKELYIYIFGSINVGNVANGIYEASIFLYIDYD